MSEQKLRDAFDHMGPDETTRQRMLANILAEHEAGSLEQSLPNTQPHSEQVMPFTPQIETQIPTHAEKLPKRRRREFSLLRYALPLAACLVFAALVPPVLPQLVTVFEDIASPPPSSSVSSSNASEGVQHNLHSTYGTSNQPTTSEQTDEVTLSETPDTEVPPATVETPAEDEAGQPTVVEVPAPEASYSIAPSEEAPIEVAMPSAPYASSPNSWPSTIIDYAALALSLLACLAALVIAIRGIISWRRKNHK